MLCHGEDCAVTTAEQCDSFAMPAVTPSLVRHHAREWNDVNTNYICKSFLLLPKRILCTYVHTYNYTYIHVHIYMCYHTCTYCILHVLCSLLLCVYLGALGVSYACTV